MQTYEIWQANGLGADYEKLIVLVGDGEHRYIFGQVEWINYEWLQANYVLIGKLNI